MGNLANVNFFAFISNSSQVIIIIIIIIISNHK